MWELRLSKLLTYYSWSFIDVHFCCLDDRNFDPFKVVIKKAKFSLRLTN
jgi:hypothetical protein